MGQMSQYFLVIFSKAYFARYFAFIRRKFQERTGKRYSKASLNFYKINERLDKMNQVYEL